MVKGTVGATIVAFHTMPRALHDHSARFRQCLQGDSNRLARAFGELCDAIPRGKTGAAMPYARHFGAGPGGRMSEPTGGFTRENFRGGDSK